MCIPGHSRDSVCLHCRPAPVARRGARTWNRNGNRCAEPHPAQRPPATPGTMTALPCRGRGRHGQNRAGPPCPRIRPRKPGPPCSQAWDLPRRGAAGAPVNKAQGKHADAPARLRRLAEAGDHRHCRRRSLPTRMGSPTRRQGIGKDARTPCGLRAVHAPVTTGIRPGGTRLPGRLPTAYHHSSAPGTPATATYTDEQRAKKNPWFPRGFVTSREIPASQYGVGTPKQA